MYKLPIISSSSWLQVVFEGLGMGSYLPLSPPELALRSWAAQRPEVAANEALCGLVVDCGFSFTHVVPIFDGVVLQKGVRRIDLGGKALTNYLKELVSFRYAPPPPPPSSANTM
jgi:actin-related protein 6